MSYKSNSPYGTAQICYNGHVIVTAIELYQYDMELYCTTCGENTMTRCLNCNIPIKGEEKITFESAGIISSSSEYHKPSYCRGCGKPYPWISRSIEAAIELADFIEGFSEADKELLTSTLNDLVRDSPKKDLSAVKLKKLLKNVGEPHLLSALKDTVNGVIAEPIIKFIWG